MALHRTKMQSNSASWNVRDRHMAETMDRLLTFTGPGARAVVWEHNTLVGDARFTDMTERGEVNVGQLTRARSGEKNTVRVGFGTHQGTVIAGREWDAPWEEMRVPTGRPGSWEDVRHRASSATQTFIFRPESSAELEAVRGHRATGVVYRPDYEQYGNDVPTVLPRRYDAFLSIDRTTALRPLSPSVRDEVEEELPETFPTGVETRWIDGRDGSWEPHGSDRSAPVLRTEEARPCRTSRRPPVHNFATFPDGVSPDLPVRFPGASGDTNSSWRARLDVVPVTITRGAPRRNSG